MFKSNGYDWISHKGKGSVEFDSGVYHPCTAFRDGRCQAQWKMFSKQLGDGVGTYLCWWYACKLVQWKKLPWCSYPLHSFTLSRIFEVYFFGDGGYGSVIRESGMVLGDHHLVKRFTRLRADQSLDFSSGWWFQIFFIFTPIWGRFPFWLIFFRWVETTNQNRLINFSMSDHSSLVLCCLWCLLNTAVILRVSISV